MWHILKAAVIIIAALIFAAYLFLCAINLIDNDSNTHLPP